MRLKSANKWFILTFGLLLSAYILYSINIVIEHQHQKRKVSERNYQLLSFISTSGNNLAAELKAFLEGINMQVETSEAISYEELFNSWRIVSAENRQILSYSPIISILLPEDERADWSTLHYSLNRVEAFIFYLTHSFLEQQSYELSSEEFEKLEAVITFYSAISEEVNNKRVSLKSILEAIREPMIIIDDYYELTLEQASE